MGMSENKKRPHVRPWALSGPIIVLLLALPLLRPLRHPLDVSHQEASKLAAVQARVEHRVSQWTVGDQQPIVPETMPVMSLLLSGPYWLMHRVGLKLDENAALVTYLL